MFKRFGEENSKENIYYKLRANINDLASVIAEHSMFNSDSGYLQYALIQENNDYFFFDVRKHSMLLKHLSSSKKFICPFCKEDLFVKSGYTNRYGTFVPQHLSHYPESNESSFCIFRTNSQYEKKKFFSRVAEGYRHYQTKIAFFKLANLGALKIEVLDSYEIYRDDNELTAFANKTFKTMNIVKADMEKQALKKEGDINGFRPDLTLYTDTGEVIYAEITDTNGKTVSQYLDRWTKANNICIEIVPVLDDNGSLMFSNNKNFQDTNSYALDEYYSDKENLYRNNRSINLLYLESNNIDVRIPAVKINELYIPIKHKLDKELYDIGIIQSQIREERAAAERQKLIEEMNRRKQEEEKERERLRIEEEKEQERLRIEIEKQRQKLRIEEEYKRKQREKQVKEAFERQRKELELNAKIHYNNLSEKIQKFSEDACRKQSIIYDYSSKQWKNYRTNEIIECKWKNIMINKLVFKKCLPDVAWESLAKFKAHIITDLDDIEDLDR